MVMPRRAEDWIDCMCGLLFRVHFLKLLLKLDWHLHWLHLLGLFEILNPLMHATGNGYFMINAKFYSQSQKSGDTSLLLQTHQTSFDDGFLFFYYNLLPNLINCYSNSIYSRIYQSRHFKKDYENVLAMIFVQKPGCATNNKIAGAKKVPCDAQNNQLLHCVNFYWTHFWKFRLGNLAKYQNTRAARIVKTCMQGIT